MAKKPKDVGTEKSLLSQMLEFDDGASYIEDSIYDNTPLFNTGVYALNLALSGSLHQGGGSGILQVVGDSKTFKSSFACVMIAKYLNDEPDAFVLFFNSEFANTKEYMINYGVDLRRVIEIPVSNIDDIKKSMVKRLDKIPVGAKVFIFVDSIGQLGSKKELEDTLNKDDLPGMSGMKRANDITSLFRLITPAIGKKRLFAYVINHYYNTMDLYPQKIIKGGKQIELSSESIWYISRVQIKDDEKNIIGYTFNIQIFKSRVIKEGIKIPITVTFDEQINPYTGLFDIALGLDWIVSPQKGWYKIKQFDASTGEITISEKQYRRSAIELDHEFWEPVVSCPYFNGLVESAFKLFSENKKFEVEFKNPYDNIHTHSEDTPEYTDGE